MSREANAADYRTLPRGVLRFRLGGGGARGGPPKRIAGFPRGINEQAMGHGTCKWEGPRRALRGVGPGAVRDELHKK